MAVKIKLSKIFPGKKVYAAGAAAILTGGAAYLGGDATKIEAIQLVATGLIGIFLRSGMKAEVANNTV